MDDDHAVAVGQRRFDRIRQPSCDVAAHDKAVDHQLDEVLLVLFQRDLLAQIVEIAVDAHAGKAAAPRALKHLAVLALLAPDHRREHLKARTLRQLKHAVDDLIDALPLDLAPAPRAVRRADARPEQAQIVINLRDRADGRARVLGGGLLVDGNRRGQALNHVDIRLVHLPQKLAHIGRKRLDIAPPPLGIDRVKRE